MHNMSSFLGHTVTHRHLTAGDIVYFADNIVSG